MKPRRTAAGILAACLLLTPLAGCSGTEDAPTAMGGNAAMGRYIEQEWTLPFAALNLAGLHNRPDGRIAMLLNDEEGIQRYFSTSDGDDWREETPGWMAHLAEPGLFIQHVHFNSRGEGAVAYLVEGEAHGPMGYTSGIALIDADGAVTPTPIGGEGTPWPGEGEQAADNRSPLYVSDLFLGEDGYVYLSSYGNIGRFDPATGELVSDYPPGASGFALINDQILKLIIDTPYSGGGQGAVELHLAFVDTSGEIVDTQPATDIYKSSGAIVFAGTPDGSLVLVSDAGIFRLADGGDIWEKILDGSLSSLSMPSVNPRELLVHGDNEFLVLTQGALPTLLNFVYSPDTPTLPDTELTVYSMVYDRTLMQAVGTYRQTHPNVVVNVHRADDFMGTAMNGYDFRNLLNTELLAGNGPDLLILDRLPMESYMEKGVLRDLSHVVGPLIESGTVLPNVVEAFRQDSGEIYAVPTRFSISTLWGEREAVAAAASLEALADYAQANPDERLFADLSPDLMLFQFGRLFQNSFLDAKGRFDTEAVARFYTDIKRLTDTAGGRYQLDDTEPTAFHMDYWNFVDDLDSTGMFALHEGKAQLMFGYLGGFSSIMAPSGTAYVRNGGAPVSFAAGDLDTVSDDRASEFFTLMPGSGTGVFFPQSIIGINAAGENLALAEELVLAMLDEATQNVGNGRGFPVNRKSIDYNIHEENDYYVSHSYTDGDGAEVTVEMTWPSTATLQAVADCFGSLQTPVFEDFYLQGAVITEAAAYFDGIATAEQAAAAAGETLRLYLSE